MPELMTGPRGWRSHFTRLSPNTEARVIAEAHDPAMDHQELHEALEWLRRAIAVGEAALQQDLPGEVREEWILALEKKRELLAKLIALNRELLLASAEERERNMSNAAPASPLAA